MTDNYIKRTSYFKQPWIWVKTIIIVFIFLVVLLTWESLDEGTSYSWIKYVAFTGLSLAFITAPIDDLAFDKKYFYHLRTSLLPALCKVNAFEIAKIKSIRAGGQLTLSMDVLEFLTARGGRRNTIEIILTDDSYRSLDVAIYKEELTEMISQVKGLVKEAS